MDLEKIYDWENMALSSITTLMVKWFNFDKVEMTTTGRVAVESGIWFDITIHRGEIGKGGHQWSVSGQRTDIVKRRLIEFLDGQNVRADFLKSRAVGEKI
jgi:hypothetical protein